MKHGSCKYFQNVKLVHLLIEFIYINKLIFIIKLTATGRIFNPPLLWGLLFFVERHNKIRVHPFEKMIFISFYIPLCNILRRGGLHIHPVTQHRIIKSCLFTEIILNNKQNAQQYFKYKNVSRETLFKWYSPFLFPLFRIIYYIPILF